VSHLRTDGGTAAYTAAVLLTPDAREGIRHHGIDGAIAQTVCSKDEFSTQTVQLTHDFCTAARDAAAT
jgi:hypothetical protein